MRSAQVADAVEFAAVQHHAGEAGKVVGGGEEPGMPGDAAHVAGGRVMHHAAQRSAGPGEAFGGSDARNQRSRGLEHRLLHAKGEKDVFPDVVGQHLAAEPVDAPSRAVPPAATLCMILSNGKYSKFEPWRDSTNTLVTFP